MSLKALLYLLAIPLVFIALDSININAIFKKNKVYQARLLYLFLIMGLSYLIVNFFYDFFLYNRVI